MSWKKCFQRFKPFVCRSFYPCISGDSLCRTTREYRCTSLPDRVYRTRTAIVFVRENRSAHLFHARPSVRSHRVLRSAPTPIRTTLPQTPRPTTPKGKRGLRMVSTHPAVCPGARLPESAAAARASSSTSPWPSRTVRPRVVCRPPWSRRPGRTVWRPRPQPPTNSVRSRSRRARRRCCWPSNYTTVPVVLCFKHTL